MSQSLKLPRSSKIKSKQTLKPCRRQRQCTVVKWINSVLKKRTNLLVTKSVKCPSEAVWSIFCDGNSYGCDTGIFIFLRTLHIPITESTDDDNNNAWAGPESILQSTHSTHTIMSRSTDIWTCVLCRGPPWRKSECFTFLLIRIFFWMKLIYLCQRSFETLHSSPGLNGWGQWTVLCW